MRKIIVVICLIAGIINSAFAQKPPIDTSVYKKWPELFAGNITNNGKYTFYTVGSQLAGSHTMIICSTENNWRKIYHGEAHCQFTNDSKKALITSNDSLFLLTLGTNKLTFIAEAPYGNLNINDILTYTLKTDPKDLVVINLRSGRKTSFNDIEKYALSDSGNNLLLQQKTDHGGGQKLTLFSLLTGDRKIIWTGSNNDNVVLKNDGSQVAFMVHADPSDNTIWYYRVTMSAAQKIADDQNLAIGDNLRLKAISNFSKNGDKLFVLLGEKKKKEESRYDVRLNVWSYADPSLQSQQLNAHKFERNYLAVISLENNKLTKLSNANDAYGNFIDNPGIMIQEYGAGTRPTNEDSWNRKATTTEYLISSKDGSRKKIPPDSWQSANGKYVVYFDTIHDGYFIYNVQSGNTRNLTNGIATNWGGPTNDIGYWHYERPAAWVGLDNYLLLYDRYYDIWLIDPLGVKSPLNLTNGYAKKHHICFHLLDNTIPLIEQQIVVEAFDQDTKDAGYFRINVFKQRDPILLTMGPYKYTIATKSKDRLTYLLYRSSSEHFPNIFITKDFRHFHQLSDIHPEKDYNWMASELLKFRTLDGSYDQAILYKPEDFDPNKKYPVIFHYYETKTDNLNAYVRPKPSDGDLNVALYISNGYLVVEPDIYYPKAKGQLYEGTYNCIVGAAKYVLKLPYVDSAKMAIQGESWGGIQTNYLVTHTHFFAAACSASGLSDWISDYGEVDGGGSPGQIGLEGDHGQNHMGASIWQNPDLYIKNSAVMSADKVTTPLLLFTTTVDSACPFPQSLEFFIDLRRLGKKVWMLEYQDGNHGVWGRPAEDFSLRMSQFFDYYLKGKPAPKWMIEGIPASLKGKESGLELEPPGVAPGPGLLKTPQK